MLHDRQDYNERVQDSMDIIPENEPVLLIRAQDICAPLVMRFWASLHLANGGDKVLYERMMDHAQKAEEWQHSHGCKMADF